MPVLSILNVGLAMLALMGSCWLTMLLVLPVNWFQHKWLAFAAWSTALVIPFLRNIVWYASITAVFYFANMELTACLFLLNMGIGLIQQVINRTKYMATRRAIWLGYVAKI